MQQIKFSFQQAYNVFTQGLHYFRFIYKFMFGQEYLS